MSHLGGASLDHPDKYTFMPDVWERLARDYNIDSVIDLGAGAGWAAEWFGDRMKHVLAIDGDPMAVERARARSVYIREHDFTRGPYDPVFDYGLCWCAEFVEHVEEKYISNWMAVCKRCCYVCMTFAPPGQGGFHHVNEQPEAYWLGIFAAYGFSHVQAETEKLRATANGEPWGRPHLTFFKNNKWH